MTTAPTTVLTTEQRSKLAMRRRKPFDPRSVELPPLPQVPGMIREEEGRYLYWLTSRAYAGSGAVVEVGSWLGRSTIHLAAGLRDAGYDDALHCFDQFSWRRSHILKATLPLSKGEDFQPYFERNVRPVYPGIRVTKTAIRDLSWDLGPVEILFLDAPKTLPDLSAVLAVFGPHLMPGLSVIVFQDYQHFPSYPIPALVSCLQEELEPLHAIDEGGCVSFEVRRPMRFDLAQPIGWNFARWTREEASARWRRVLSPLPRRVQSRVASGLVVLLYDSLGREAACDVLREMKRDDEMLAEWRRLATFPFYGHYRPLFRILGVPPLRGKYGVLTPLVWRFRLLRRRFIKPVKLALKKWLLGAHARRSKDPAERPGRT